jgi:hypothetical protein
MLADAKLADRGALQPQGSEWRKIAGELLREDGRGFVCLGPVNTNASRRR